ncbi:MAG: carbohydrate ABC transporter permease [Halolamina sp.]
MSEKQPPRPTGRVAAALDRHLPVLMLLPAVLLVLGVLLYPLAWAIKLSVFQTSITNLDSQTFVWFANYVAVLTDPLFGRVVRNTLVFVGGSVVGQVGIGLALALLLDADWPGQRLTRLFRATYVVPWATTGVVVAYSWQFVFAPRAGLVNTALRWLGVAQPPAWLQSVEWAMAAVVVANVWRGVPFSLVIQTSGLQRVPAALTEAARIGGASRLQTVRHVTLPLVRPFVAMNLLLVLLFTLNVFDIVLVMTGGGPLESTQVLALHMYETAFQLGRFGRAAALAVVLFALNLLLVTGYVLTFGVGRGEP